MEDAPGAQLGTAWPGMSLARKMKVIEGLVSIERKLSSISFNRYGNLYFSNNWFPGCIKAEIAGNIEDSVKDEVSRRFVIGPVVKQSFWDQERVLMEIDRGPWADTHGYLRAIANKEIDRISNITSEASNQTPRRAAAQKSPMEYISLYRKFEAIAPFVVPGEGSDAPTLWHWDLHAWNLFTQDDRITSVIDWQFAWTGPLCLQYQQPKLVDYNGPVMLKLPETFEQIQNDDERNHIRTQVYFAL